jgi:hypothetical protein
MANPTVEEIRHRAFQLWQEAGEPDGKSDAFWYQAEKRLFREEPELGALPPGMTDNLPV